MVFSTHHEHEQFTQRGPSALGRLVVAYERHVALVVRAATAAATAAAASRAAADEAAAATRHCRSLHVCDPRKEGKAGRAADVRYIASSNTVDGIAARGGGALPTAN